MKKKIFKKVFLIIVIVLITLSIIYLLIPSDRYKRAEQIKWGVTFSNQYAQSLGLNWKEVYVSMLEDLQIESMRLPVYWDSIELKPNEYDFSDIDWQLSEAKKHGVKVTLAIGYKLPRWPECRKPDWLGDDIAELEKELFEMLTTVVTRYRDNDTITAWQVENEPLFEFGECLKTTNQMYYDEVALVKSLDSRPVLITDSGELSTWRKASKSGADILGVSTYNVVWNPYIGYFRWRFLTPTVYRKKTSFISKDIKDVYLSELQLEPWFNADIKTFSLEEQMEIFGTDDIARNLKFGKDMGFEHVYLWGVEWWYYLDVNFDDKSILNQISDFLDSESSSYIKDDPFVIL